MINLMIESTNKIVLFHKYCLGLESHSSSQNMLPVCPAAASPLPCLLLYMRREAESKVKGPTGLVLLCL